MTIFFCILVLMIMLCSKSFLLYLPFLSALSWFIILLVIVPCLYYPNTISTTRVPTALNQCPKDPSYRYFPPLTTRLSSVSQLFACGDLLVSMFLLIPYIRKIILSICPSFSAFTHCSLDLSTQQQIV